LLIQDEHSEPLEVAGSPIGEVSARDGHSCGYLPAKLSFVREADMEVKESFFEFMLNPIDDFAAQAMVWTVRFYALGHRASLALAMTEGLGGSKSGVVVKDPER
jgi:hypothetical protein